ncbi:MAG: cytochrome c [Magnetococcales bacterium]|nr:cytochrome c [Magnetococcales bacterium]
MSHIHYKALLLAATLTLAATPALAGDNAVVKHRKSVMTGIGAAMGATVCQLKGQCNMKPKVLLRQAKTLAFLSSISADSFRQATPNATMKTTSTDNVWSDWAEFDKGLNTMTKRARNLVKVVKAGADKAALGKAVGKLGKTCKGCHDNFRKKKKK